MAKTENTAENQEVASSNNDPLFVLLDTDKVKLIRSVLGERTYFMSTEESTAYAQLEAHIATAAAKTENFYGLKIAVGNGVETAARLVCATVGVRDKGNGKDIPARNGIKAIVIFKQPSVAEFLADESEAARGFVQKLVEREATDVAFSGIRAAETGADLETIMAGLPDTIGGIVENARQSAAGATSFDIMWADFRKAFLKPKYKTLDDALPQKPDVLKAIKSKAYALANPLTNPIETHDYFAKIANIMIQMAKQWKNDDGEVVALDTSDMQSWVENRDTNVIEYKAPEVTAESLAGLDF